MTAVPEETDDDHAPATAGVAGLDPVVSPEWEPLDPFLGWTEGDRRAILGLVAITLVLAGWQLYSAARRPQPVAIARLASETAAYRLDVNRATWVEWAQLDGIGETLSQAIVDDRQANGPFTSIDDIARVKGIGPKKLDAIRRWLVISDPPGPTESRSKGRTVPTSPP